MAEPAHKLIEVGLVLQGGGALGAYECGGVGALLELMAAETAAGSAIVLKSVVGVSIGAINAACVVGAKDWTDAKRRLDAMWDDLTLMAPDFWPRQAKRDLSLFGLPGFYWPRSDFLNVARWTSYYTTSPMLKTLEKHVDFAALNASETYFMVNAVDIKSGELKRFCNRPLDDDPATTIEPRHVMASGSLPPQFPWTTIGDNDYWDGGLVDNAPLGDAIDAFSRGPEVRRVLVVMDLYPLAARLPRTLADVDDRLHELSFGNRVRQDRETAERINDFVCTVDDLAGLVPPENVSPELAERIARARAFKTIDVVDIDMQSAMVEGKPRRQDPSDDEFGLRDFSADTVKRRREVGYRLAREGLATVFARAA
jgi:NTE family protein